jgi:hypothetical protein
MLYYVPVSNPTAQSRRPTQTRANNPQSAIRNPQFFLAVILPYAAITAVLMVYHQPWRDEAQSWLLVRDLDLGALFAQMKYEGSPALWHLILFPFAKAGLPYFTEFCIHWVLAIATLSVFLLTAPFSRLTKALFAFSYLMAFEYSVIARNYVLTVLLLFVIAALYRRRFQLAIPYGLAICLLFNTNVHSFAVGASLAGLFAWEAFRRRAFTLPVATALGLMIVGGLAALAQVWPTEDCVYGGVSYDVPWTVVSNIFFSGAASHYALPSAIVLAIAILAMAKKPQALLIFVPMTLWITWIAIFKSQGGPRHHGLIFITLLVSLWIGQSYDERPSQRGGTLRRLLQSPWPYRAFIIILNVCLAISALAISIPTWHDAITRKFSGSKDVAEFLRDGNFQDRPLIAQRDFKVSAILPYFPAKKAWYADKQEYGSFITWDRKWKRQSGIPNFIAIARAKKAFGDQVNLCFLLDEPLRQPAADGLQLVWGAQQTTQTYFGLGDEFYFVYVPTTPDWGKHALEYKARMLATPPADQPAGLERQWLEDPTTSQNAEGRSEELRPSTPLLPFFCGLCLVACDFFLW